MRGWAVVATGSTLVLASSIARADAAACVDAADRGQRARAVSKLHDARDYFLSCSAPMCPETVQRDCLYWANDTIERIPSIVIDATDDEGRDVGDASVFIDGSQVASVTEGRSITLDPGPHDIRIERFGTMPVTQHIIAKEGMHARRIPAALLRPRRDDSPPAPPSSESPSANDDDRPKPTHRVWALGAMGIGAATLTMGSLLVVRAADLTGDSGSDLTTVGWATIALGGALGLAGAFAYFSEPAKPRPSPPRAATIAPFVGAGTGGVAATGSF